jgi:hypothetical protein
VRRRWAALRRLAASCFARALTAARLALAAFALARALVRVLADRAALAFAALVLAALALAVLAALALACAAASAFAADDADGSRVVAAPYARGAMRAGTVPVAVAVTSTAADEPSVLTGSELLKAMRPSTSTPSHNAGRPSRISCRFGYSHSGGQAHSMGRGHSHTMTAASSTRRIQMKMGMST